MTWAIQKTATPRPAQGPDIAPPSNWEGMGAVIRSSWRDQDLYLNFSRAKEQEATPVAITAGERVGVGGLNDYFRENNPNGPGVEMPEGTSVQDFIDWYGPDLVLEAARKQADMSPDKWSDLDLSAESIEAKAVERQKAEAERDDELLSLSPNPLRNSLLGGLAGAVADPLNIALLPFGAGAGSLWRVMLTEGALGAGAEAIQFPARTRVAERLDRPAPDFTESITLGFLGGAILGGVIDAVPRGIRAYRYAKALRQMPELRGFDAIGSESGARAAETALETDRNPLDAVTEVLRQTPPREFRQPLILTPEMSVTARTPEPTALAPNPITTESLPPLPGDAPTTPGETAALAEDALNRLSDLAAPAVKRERRAPGDWRYPILETLKRRGGVAPGTDFASELRARDITPKTYPGLFRKGGEKGYDALPWSEWTESFPALHSIRDGDYLDADGFLAAIDRELRGTDTNGAPLSLAERKRAAAAEARAAAAYDPQEAFQSKQPSETGFFVDLDAYGFTHGDSADFAIERDFSAYLAESWPGVRFQPREVDEMLAYLKQYGGEAEDLVVSALSREMDFADLPPKEAAKYDTGNFWETDPAFFGRSGAEDAGASGSGGGGTGRSVADTQAARGGAAGAGRDYGVEAQTFIPGSRVDDSAVRQAEIAKREAEVKALQSKQRRLNQVRVEDDVDGLFAQKQIDIFDDLMSPQAQRAMDAEMQALRNDAEGDGFAAVADDGRKLDGLQAIIREIDDMDTLAREFNLCRFGGTTE